MAERIHVSAELLQWACARSAQDVGDLEERFPQLDAWIRGKAAPTFKQLEKFAKATYTPIGYLFLPAPPEEKVPIPDFRTDATRRAHRPSPDLLETIYVCQQRQEWYRGYARSMGEKPLSFVGSIRLAADPSSSDTGGPGNIVAAAGVIRDALGFDIEARRQMPTWTDALRHFIEQADAAGMMVMCSGVVLNNNRRRLDSTEFRGFAMADEVAPLVFINGADTKAGQMFTLAHELAHIWLGQSAVSDAEPAHLPEQTVERWCNRVAAELLVPLAALKAEYDPDAELRAELDRLARRFKVSTLVVLRRIHDAGGLTWEQLWEEYERELRLIASIQRSGGGNFYLTQAARVSKRFARALLVSTWEGRSSFTEAFRLLGIKRMETFRGMGEGLGVVV
jgi:Zn-dependent peptidase ImmA (M78 family)